MAQTNFLRLDKVKQLGHYESVLVAAEDELLAGHFLKLGTVVNTAEGEEVNYTKAEANGDFDVIVAPVYLEGEELTEGLLTKSTKGGKPVRGYHVEKGDIISFNEGLAAGLAKGDFVAVGADGLGLQEALDEATSIGQVIDVNWLEFVGNLVVVRFTL